MLQIKNQKETWLIDSGYTNHMSKHSQIYKEIDSSIKVPVRMENGVVVKYEGKVQLLSKQIKEQK